MKLSAVLIAKNEGAVIADCLMSLRGFDEVVVVDTGSEDSTVAVAKGFDNVKVFTDYKWNDDFAEARNHALSKATGDWVMSIDADHVLATPAFLHSLVEQADSEGCKALTITLEHDPSGQRHHAAWLFKRDPAIFYEGRIHEHINISPNRSVPVTQKYRKSPAHALDPDRNLRILQKSPDTPRTRFYLAREYADRRDWAQTIPAMHKYLEIADYLPEICEAHLTLARGYWACNNGQLARKHCLEAVRNNPMFKEALLFMGELHYEPWKGKWLRLAGIATNEDVLFIRAR